MLQRRRRARIPIRARRSWDIRRPRNEELLRGPRHNIRTTHLSQAVGSVLVLPVCPDLVEPGVVQVEEGVPGAGDAVEHLEFNCE